jgi:hypothetical protein
MKKTVCMTMAALVAAAGLAFAQADKKMAAKPMAASSVNETLMHHENEMLEQFAKKDFTAFKKRIMPGAWSVDESGYMTVEDLVKQATDPKANLMWSYKVSDMKAVDIDANAKLVTYKIDQKGSMMGQPFPPVVYATTIWANHGGNWMAVFHQESTAAPPAKK